jgi:hypothetical protein
LGRPLVRVWLLRNPARYGITYRSDLGLADADGLENGRASRYWLIGDLKKHRGSIRMRVIRAAAMIVMLAGPAYAQQKQIPKYGEEDKDKTAVEKEADKAAERAYQRSLGNIPDKGGSTDPWGIARSTDAPKATARTTPAVKKPPAKTGSTAN